MPRQKIYELLPNPPALDEIPVSSETLLDLIRVSKTYFPTTRAIENLSLPIHRHDMLYLIGASGSGKTTLLKILANFEEISSGSISAFGQDMKLWNEDDRLAYLRRIGFIFPDFRLFGRLTVRENIAMPMEVAYYSRAEIEKTIGYLCDRLGISTKLDSPVMSISQGEQQRVAVARAVATCPEIVFADEPTGNLDPKSAEMVMQLLQDLRKTGTALVIATHDFSLTTRFPGRILPLRHHDLPEVAAAFEKTLDLPTVTLPTVSTSSSEPVSAQTF